MTWVFGFAVNRKIDEYDEISFSRDALVAEQDQA